MKRVRVPLAIGWAAVLGAVLFAQTYVRAQRPNGIDLTSYLLSADMLRHGGSPYVLPTPFPYVYPPTLAFLLIPMTIVPSIVAVVVWFALNVVAAVWSIRATVRRMRPEADTGDVTVFLALFFTLFFTVAQSNLRNGQVNLIVLALSLCAALIEPGGVAGETQHDRDHTAAPAAMPRGLPRGISVSTRRGWGPAASGKKLAGGLSWSLAIAVKVVPLILTPYFMLRRSWEWMIASVALIAMWCLLPAVVVGRRIVDIYDQFGRVLGAMNLSRVETLDFSFAGAVSWIARTPMTPVLEASGAAVVLGWIIAVDGRRLRTETLRPMALYLLAVPLVSPHSEVHHLAFVLPAAAVVTAAVWRDWHAGNRRQQASAAAAVLLYLAATASPWFTGPLFFASLIAFGVALMNVKEPAQV